MDDFSRALAAAAVIDGQHFTLPGCGTLEGTYVPARVDHVARTVQPPTLEVSWSGLPSDEAQTFAELLATSGATNAEAAATQAAWIEALHAGDPIRVGDLGTLRLDGATGEIAFEADESGLRGAFWAGGPVAVEPIARRGAPAEVELAAHPVAPPPPRRFRPRGGGKRNPAFVTGGAVALALAIFGYVTLADDAPSGPPAEVDPATGQAVPVRSERLNRSPRDTYRPEAGASEPTPREHPADRAEAGGGRPGVAPSPTRRDGGEASTASAPDPASGEAAETPPALAPAPTETVGPAASRPPAPAAAEPAPEVPASFDPASLAGESRDFDPDAVQAVILLGSFGDADNAARLTERVASEGLIPYVGQRGRLTQVGVTVSASGENELAALLQRLRADYNPEAYVLERG